jgi:hypothetical protein
MRGRPADRPGTPAAANGEDGRAGSDPPGKAAGPVAEARQPETAVTVAALLRQYMDVAELDGSTRQTYRLQVLSRHNFVHRQLDRSPMSLPSVIFSLGCLISALILH